MTLVSVDPVDYADAASNFEAIRANAVRRLGALLLELRSYDNMAGTDPGGRQFSVEYDAGAADIVTGLDYLAVRASELDFGLMSTASEHYLTEQVAAGNVSASTIYEPRPPYSGESPPPPPSSFGGDPNPPTDVLGEIWATVAGFIGQMFPDANTKKLRSAAKTWELIGQHLDEVASEIGRADDPLNGNQSREIGLIQAEVRELKSLITQMAREADLVAGSCTEYAQIVEDTLEETFAMLRQLAIEVAVGAGISVALSFVTFGGAAVAGAAALTVRIAAVAARIGGLIGRVLGAAANLAARIGSAAARVRGIVAQLAPRTQRIIRISSTVVGDTSASLFAEGVVRGENANYFSAFAGGLVGSGTTAGILEIFGSRAARLLPNLLAGGAGGFTGSLASGGVEGNITAQNLVFGTVFGTAGGTLGAGGGSRTPNGAPPVSGGGTPAAGGGTPGSGSPRPPLGEGPVVPPGAGGAGRPPVDVDPFTPEVDASPTPPAGGGSTPPAGSGLPPVDVDPFTPEVDVSPPPPVDSAPPVGGDSTPPVDSAPPVGSALPPVDVDPFTPEVDVDPTPPVGGDSTPPVDSALPPVDVDPFTPEVDVVAPLDGGTSPDAPGSTPEGWRPLDQATVDNLPVVRDGSHTNPDGTPKPDIWYQTGQGEYIYHSDANGYIDRYFTSNLELGTHDGRLDHNPNTPGKLPGDHAGHLAADRFGGSPELDNIVSQLSTINLSDYKKLENLWAAALRADPPATVQVDVRIATDATGRPTSFDIQSLINGDRYDLFLTQ